MKWPAVPLKKDTPYTNTLDCVAFNSDVQRIIILHMKKWNVEHIF